MTIEKAMALRIKELLEEKKMTVEDLSVASGESVETIQKLLNEEIPLGDLKSFIFAVKGYSEDHDEHDQSRNRPLLSGRADRNI